MSYSDHLAFHDATGSYKAKIDAVIAKSGETESVVMSAAALDGIPVMLGVMDFSFMGGSLGTGTGERIARACEQAIAERRPLVICSASGGARMHEGILSLMQMAKTSAAQGLIPQAAWDLLSARSRENLTLCCGPFVDDMHHVPPMRTIIRKGFRLMCAEGQACPGGRAEPSPQGAPRSGEAEPASSGTSAAGGRTSFDRPLRTRS